MCVHLVRFTVCTVHHSDSSPDFCCPESRLFLFCCNKISHTHPVVTQKKEKRAKTISIQSFHWPKRDMMSFHLWGSKVHHSSEISYFYRFTIFTRLSSFHSAEIKEDLDYWAVDQDEVISSQSLYSCPTSSFYSVRVLEFVSHTEMESLRVELKMHKDSILPTTSKNAWTWLTYASLARMCWHDMKQQSHEGAREKSRRILEIVQFVLC